MDVRRTLHRRKRRGARALATAIALHFVLSKVWAAEPKMDFNIPAGDAARALTDWALQANVSVMWFIRDLTQPHPQTPPVKGVLTQQDALCLLLQGTGLTFAVVGAAQDAADGNGYLIVPEGSAHPDGEPMADNYDQACAQPAGFGPTFIKVPMADWRT